jgi:hypothetical protein
MPRRVFDKIDVGRHYDGSVNVDNLIYRNDIDATGTFGYSDGKTQEEIRQIRVSKMFYGASEQIKMRKLQADLTQPNLHQLVLPTYLNRNGSY